MPGRLFDVHNAPWLARFECFDYESPGRVPAAQVMLGWVWAIPSAPAFTWVHTVSQK